MLYLTLTNIIRVLLPQVFTVPVDRLQPIELVVEPFIELIFSPFVRISNRQQSKKPH